MPPLRNAVSTIQPKTKDAAARKAHRKSKERIDGQVIEGGLRLCRQRLRVRRSQGTSSRFLAAAALAQRTSSKASQTKTRHWKVGGERGEQFRQEFFNVLLLRACKVRVQFSDRRAKGEGRNPGAGQVREFCASHESAQTPSAKAALGLFILRLFVCVSLGRRASPRVTSPVVRFFAAKSERSA